MKIENIVTNIETSRLLSKIIVPRRSLFSYYKNSSGKFYVAETSLNVESQFDCYCYTYSELLNLLPGAIEIGGDTYIASTHSYEKLILDEGRDYEIARLEVLKVDEHADSIEYVARYAYDNRGIALGQNQKGEYRNLIRFGKNETEALAAIFLALIDEEIL